MKNTMNSMNIMNIMTRLLANLSHALINLAATKLRSLLAILGVLIGTAAVVTLLSCGQLATEQAIAQFKTLGTDLLAVSVFQQVPGNSGGNSVNLDDWRQMASKIPNVRQLAPYSIIYQPISFQGSKIKGAIIGADESLAKLIHIQLTQGNFVSFVESFEHFCVIGARVAQSLREVSAGNLIGEQLRIGHTLYTIIGELLPWQENGFFNEDINQAVIIPIGGIALVGKDNKINNAILQLNEQANIDAVIAHIQQIIQQQAPKLSVFARSAKQIIAHMENQGHIFTLLLAVIGSVALLVGGVGIMNVMLAAVLERKKEIGIRKAVGATRRDIQLLFLIESILLSVLGGLLGLVLGVVITYCVAYYSHWAFTLLYTPLLIGFLISVITGVFFGFYPAKRASNMAAVVSLQHG